MIVLFVVLVRGLSAEEKCFVSSLSNPSNSGYFSYPIDIFSTSPTPHSIDNSKM